MLRLTMEATDRAVRLTSDLLHGAPPSAKATRRLLSKESLGVAPGPPGGDHIGDSPPFLRKTTMLRDMPSGRQWPPRPSRQLGPERSTLHDSSTSGAHVGAYGRSVLLVGLRRAPTRAVVVAQPVAEMPTDAPVRRAVAHSVSPAHVVITQLDLIVRKRPAVNIVQRCRR